MPIARGIMQIGRINVYPTVTTVVIPDSYFCANQSFSIEATVTSGVATPTGTVTFNLYTDATNFVVLGTSTLVSGPLNTGVALIDIPANFTTSGTTYYINAVFNGSTNFLPSSTGSGVAGTAIYSIGSDKNATTTVASTLLTPPFCLYNSNVFLAHVDAQHLNDDLSVGSVTWTATFASPFTTINLGTDSSILGGDASITVPPSTFNHFGDWSIVAAYTGNSCYGDSVSDPIIVNVNAFNVDMSYSSGVLEFCYADSASTGPFTFHVSSTFTSGTISGTFRLRSVPGNNVISTVTTSGPASGFNVVFNNPVSSLFPQATTGMYVQFTSTANCYFNTNSPTVGLTIKSSSNQHPDSTIFSISHTGVGYSDDTYTFSITVLKPSGYDGPLAGAGILNGTASLYFSNNGGPFVLQTNNIHITDLGGFGIGSYSNSIDGMGGIHGTGDFYVKWNGNACYAQISSSVTHIVIPDKPPV
jgi:hypothetical protein